MTRFAFAFIFLFSPFTLAQVVQGPLSRSMGGSGRAGLDSSESALLNPALIPLAINHEVDFFYGDGYAGKKHHQQFWGLGAVDNGADVMVPGSLHYVRMRETGINPTAVDHELWHFGIGRVMNSKYSFGLSGYYLVSEPEGGQKKSQGNGSAGFLYMHSNNLGVAYVLDNFVEPSSSVPLPLRQTMRQSLGLMLGIAGVARIRFDVSRDEQFNPDKMMVYQTGFESATHEYAVVRMGAKWDNLRGQNLLTAGAGFNGPRLKMDYTFEKNTKGTGGAVHSVDMRIPF